MLQGWHCTKVQSSWTGLHLCIAQLQLCSCVRGDLLPVGNLCQQLLDVTLTVLQLPGQYTGMRACLCEGSCLAVPVIMCDGPCDLHRS